MKYRFTLSRDSDNLVLTVAAWDGHSDLPHAGDGLIASQIVEDFTPEPYFMERFKQSLVTADEPPTCGDHRFTWTFSEKTLDEIISRINTLASPQRYGRAGKNYIDLIGKTPILKLGTVAEGCKATVLVKLECMEPNSVKDRPVYSIASRAIERGEITDETEVVEASSGNVAFALAAILKAILNKKPKIFISKMHGPAKRKAVRIAGVPIFLTSKAEGTASAKKASVAYAEGKANVFQVNQHGNPDNPRAHRLTTGPELYHQCHVLTGQAPAEFVTGLGSGGTAAGVALFRDDIGGDFRVIGVEPEEASLNTGGTFHAHGFSGLAPGFITDIVKRNRDRIDHIETASWEEGSEICRRMLVEEGLLIGASSGASIAVALRRARLPENEGKVIVTIAHDRGDRYIEIEDLFVPPPEATEESIDPND